MTFARSLLLASTAIFSLTAAGQSFASDTDLIQEDKHVHGEWELFAALDDDVLTISITGPIVDAVGFEHPPASASEHEAVKKFSQDLADISAALNVNAAANCTLTGALDLDLPEGYATEDAHHHEASHTDDHDDHSDHDDHDEHDHDDHDHEEHDLHDSDVTLTYKLACAAPRRLDSIEVRLFDSFPAIEEIDAVFLSDDAQESRHLRKGANIFRIPSR